MAKKQSAKVLQFPNKKRPVKATSDHRIVVYSCVAAVFFALAGFNFWWVNPSVASASRGIASVPKKLVPAWKNRLQESQFRISVLGAKPSEVDKLGYGALAGHYSLVVEKGRVMSAKLSQGREPVHISQVEEFLAKHSRALGLPSVAQMSSSEPSLNEKGYSRRFSVDNEGATQHIDLQFDDSDHLLFLQVTE